MVTIFNIEGHKRLGKTYSNTDFIANKQTEKHIPSHICLLLILISLVMNSLFCVCRYALKMHHQFWMFQLETS